MNTRLSKHVEDVYSWIKTLLWKVCILLVYITQQYPDCVSCVAEIN